MNDLSKYQFEFLVETCYLPEQSDESKSSFVFSYTIEIINVGEKSAQLISRHWIITDGNNTINEVRGEGVVGQQPIIKPSRLFKYTSGCPLSTPVGTMKGSYLFLGEDGQKFEVEIPEFVLSKPHALH